MFTCSIVLLFNCSFVDAQTKELSTPTKQFVQYWKQIADLSGDLSDFKKQTGVRLQPRLNEDSKKSLPKLYEAFDGLLCAAMGDDNSQLTITEKFNLNSVQNNAANPLKSSAYSSLPFEDYTKPLPLMPNDAVLAVRTIVTQDLKHTLSEDKTALVDYNMNVDLAKVEATSDNKEFYKEVASQLKISMNVYQLWLGEYHLKNKNILLFVNGYRFKADLKMAEYPNSNNKVYTKDIDEYWEGIDSKFIDRISTKNAIYADGHHSVATANHGSLAGFTASMASSEVARVPGGICYHVPDCVHLSLSPNTAGFAQRRENGRTAGKDLYQKLINGTIPCRKTLVNGEVQLLDTVDVVCHSMGFAYTLGILDELKTKNIAHFGWLYCLAPENACSGEVPLNNTGQVLFDEVWQYGSNELLVSQGGDPLWEQDGIAPQCAIKGLESQQDKNSYGRVYIPKEESKGFLTSHKVVNYGWVLGVPSNKRGYVKKRN